MYDVVVKRSRSLSHLLMSSCILRLKPRHIEKFRQRRLIHLT